MERMNLFGLNIPVHRCGALVIGTGCAGYNAADSLFDLGYRDIIIVTEGERMGTSRNTGSDKQTYYKLAWQSSQVDNTEKMAQTLFSGKSVHGDIAYAEAANSVRSFMKLVNLGVPFPTNEYGEFVGYQTDHTTEKRATSAGPLTSHYMTQALEREVKRKQIPIVDHTVIVELLHNEQGIVGAVGIQKAEVCESHRGVHLFLADEVILATGGPACVYQNRVYPVSQTGMTGIAIEAGAQCANLQEWQYGIASVDFRWNLSGTYQQVIPKYISVDENGVVREFLNDYFENPVEAANLVFQKGYQWPFDSAKVSGSTIIDLLVYHEQMHLGREVFLDFTTEPEALKEGFSVLSGEAYEYLKNSDALLPTPIKRLEKMNPKAIALYQSHGIDLYREPLKITVAAQHCNGGVAVDRNWESSVPGLYVVGEAAGTFGVYRPGGSALNSTQVGSLRAAEHISRRQHVRSGRDEICPSVSRTFFERFPASQQGVRLRNRRLRQIERELAQQMSTNAAHLRDVEAMKAMQETIPGYLKELDEMIENMGPADIICWFKVRDMVITVNAVIASILYASRTIGTRGGAICCQEAIDFTSAESVRKVQLHSSDEYDAQVLYFEHEKGCRFMPTRPIPQTEQWFETVWGDYCKRREESIS